MEFGAHPLIDLSTGPEIDATRRALLEESTIPLGTVPIYQVFAKHKEVRTITVDDLLGMVEHQAKQGVDYMTLHCGILKNTFLWEKSG